MDAALAQGHSTSSLSYANTAIYGRLAITTFFCKFVICYSDFLRAHRPKEEKRDVRNNENDKGDYLEPRRAGARSEEQVENTVAVKSMEPNMNE